LLASALVREPAPITQLIPCEMLHTVESLRRLDALATLRQWAAICEPNVQALVYVAAEVRRAVKPWAGANEDAADEPLRPVVAIRSTLVWSRVVVAVRAGGFEIQRDLRVSFRSKRRDAECGSSQSTSESVHESSSSSQ
jgi:hypothetical protein